LLEAPAVEKCCSGLFEVAARNKEKTMIENLMITVGKIKTDWFAIHFLWKSSPFFISRLLCFEHHQKIKNIKKLR